MNFHALTTAITALHDSLRGAAATSVNQFHTIRNWLIGMYIFEYEQHGQDRAEYGERLIRTLAERLVGHGIRGMSFTNLNLFRKFYRCFIQTSYPDPAWKLTKFIVDSRIKSI